MMRAIDAPLTGFRARSRCRWSELEHICTNHGDTIAKPPQLLIVRGITPTIREKYPSLAIQERLARQKDLWFLFESSSLWFRMHCEFRRRFLDSPSSVRPIRHDNAI